MKKVNIYTDGSCLGNPGPGGWAAILRYNKIEKEISGGTKETTNNRMELQAAIQGLAALNSHCKVDLYTDSKYVMDGINKWMVNWVKRGWKTSAGKAVKNKDLWQSLDTQTQRHQIIWHWVKGHSGHAENERADVLAREQAERIKHKEHN